MRPMTRMRVAIVASHPIQYQAPWFRALAQHVELKVFFAHSPSAKDQAGAGYGVPFDWDIDLVSGYEHVTLRNVAAQPNVYSFSGCDTPDVRDELLRFRADACIVMGWYLKTYWQATVACRRRGIPVLVRGDSLLATPRSFVKRWAKAFAYPIMLRQFDAFLYVGKNNQDYLLHYGVKPDRLFFAPHFVDTEFFRSGSAMTERERAQARAALGVAADEIVVLFVGRMVEFKRPWDLVDALARLRSSQRRYRALFVGSGKLTSALREAAERSGVAATFLGFQNQSALPRLYRIADALVLPS